MTLHRIPLVARGRVVEDYEVTHHGRYGATFTCPDPAKYLSEILLPNRREMEALYHLLLDYIVEFGSHLDPKTNPHLQWALELAGTFNARPGAPGGRGPVRV